jgi:hypothetical protein
LSDRPESKLQPGKPKEREDRSRLAELEAENRVLRAQLLKPEPSDLSLKSRKLLERANRVFAHLSQTVVDLNEAATPVKSVPISANPSQPISANSERDEGVSTRWARDLLDRIDKEVTRLCDEYDLRVADKWVPPPRMAKVRCLNKSSVDPCRAYGKRIPKYVGPRESRIELVHCQVCGKKLGEA